MSLPLQAAHQDALNNLQADVQHAREGQQSLQEQLAAKDAEIREHVQQLEQLQATITDLQSQLGECVSSVQQC